MIDPNSSIPARRDPGWARATLAEPHHFDLPAAGNRTTTKAATTTARRRPAAQAAAAVAPGSTAATRALPCYSDSGCVPRRQSCDEDEPGANALLLQQGSAGRGNRLSLHLTGPLPLPVRAVLEMSPMVSGLPNYETIENCFEGSFADGVRRNTAGSFRATSQ